MSSDEDTRIPCKYGADCYQKNPTHHEKFKHPVKRNVERSPDTTHLSKKQKLEEQRTETETITTTSPEKQKPDEKVEIEEKECSETVQTTTETNEVPKQLKSLETLEDKKQFIKEKFLLEMPEDFYVFWDLCKEMCKQNPKEAFKLVNLHLVGPFDVLEETYKVKNVDDEKYLLHWRYFYDPPEFQTVIRGDTASGFHIGYFRDTPDDLPVFVASNNANKDCIIVPMGENLFGAVNTYLENLLKTADPFKKMAITKLHKSLNNKAKELKFTLNKYTSAMQSRQRKIVCKSFHTAGIVVPFERKTELGYRKLPVDEKELRKLFDRVSRAYPEKGSEAFAILQPVLTAATIANDECDFGTALELGINIFCYGDECFNNTASRFLTITNSLLQRHVFAKIAEVHLKNRKKGKPFVIE